MLDIVSTPAILISPSNETRQTTWYKKISDEWDTFMRGRGCMSGTAQPKPLCEAPRYCQKLNDHAKSEKTIARLKYENGLQDKHVQRQFQEIGELRASHRHSRRQSQKKIEDLMAEVATQNQHIDLLRAINQCYVAAAYTTPQEKMPS